MGEGRWGEMGEITHLEITVKDLLGVAVRDDAHDLHHDDAHLPRVIKHACDG